MKKTYILFAILGFVLFNYSCADLDLYPLDTGSADTWYRDENELKISLKGLYRNTFWPIDDPRWSDDHQGRETINFITGGTINGEDGNVKDRWANAYKAIGRANIILDQLERRAEELGINPQRVEEYKAEALFVRAAQYAILTTYFGDVIYTEKLLSIEEAFDVGRTDKKEIMKYVYRDFDIAAQILPKEYSGEATRATKGMAYALKARYALFNGDWEIASQAALDCMNLGVYELHPNFSTLFLASTAKSKEAIFVTPRSIEAENNLWGDGVIKAYVTRLRGGYASEYPSWELFCSFLCNDGLPIDESPKFDPKKPFLNRDPRCTATIVEFETQHLGVLYDPNPKTTTVWNYITNKSVNNLDCKSGSQYASYNGLIYKKGVDEDWVNNQTYKVYPDNIFIRLAEVMLIYAEAKIEADDIDQSVLDAINKVRARAYGVAYTETLNYPAVTTTIRSELRKIVRIERRMELAYEGWRYMDLLRWKLADKVLNLPNYGLLDKDDLINKIVNANKWFFPSTPQIDEDGIADFQPMYDAGLIKLITRRKFDPSRNYLWPIPSKEVITNPNLGQNDNY